MNCYVCNNELIWGGDHDIEDIIEDQDHTIVTNLSCQQCGAYVEVYHGEKSGTGSVCIPVV